MKSFDRQTLEILVERLGRRLRGDWVVIGGNVLPLLGIDSRATLDLDIASPEDAGNDQITILLETALESGLPVEAVNVTAGYFLRAVDGWDRHLLEVHRGPSARILVPDPTLFVLLKLRRFTETDLADCDVMLERARKNRDPVDHDRLRHAVDLALREPTSRRKADRLGRLREALA